MRVRVFLRQPLFTLPGEGREHVPPSAVILDGTVEVPAAGEAASPLGAVMKVEHYFDERGRPLDGKAVKLIVPAVKIDHVWVQE